MRRALPSLVLLVSATIKRRIASGELLGPRFLANGPIPVDGHVPFRATAEHAAASGQRTVEHLTGMNLACSTRAGALSSRISSFWMRTRWRMSRTSPPSTASR